MMGQTYYNQCPHNAMCSTSDVTYSLQIAVNESVCPKLQNGPYSNRTVQGLPDAGNRKGHPFLYRNRFSSMGWDLM